MVKRLILLTAVVVMVALCHGPQATGKTPGWQPGEHPRLIVTAADKTATVAKLNRSNTISNAVWTAFLASNRANRDSHNYADGAFIYWTTGNETTGRQAIDFAKTFIDNHPDPLNSAISGFNDEWSTYRDLLLTYDLAYNLLTADEIQKFKTFFVQQALPTYSYSPDRYPGNKDMMYAFCLYAAGELLEGENFTIPVTDEAVVKGGTPLATNADAIHYVRDAINIKITDLPGQSASDYTEGENADFTYGWTYGLPGYGIRWNANGRHPSEGATYYVSYVVSPDTAAWKSVGKQAFDNNLNFFWHDGYYNGGLCSYAALTSEWLSYFFEMIKRDAGIDYSQNTNVKRMVDMYLYERLPSKFGTGYPQRFNSINDTMGWDPVVISQRWSDVWIYPAQNTYAQTRTWLRPFVAWATTNYAGDPEGYDVRYRWLWTQAYRNTDGTIKLLPDADWREALWINDDAFGTYPVTTVPTANWPKQRYFRGKEVVYYRTDDWTGTDTKAALFSMVSGNHNYINEHDHPDSGSFTFFSLGEDWAIDPGYQDEYTKVGEQVAFYGGRVIDHNSVGFDNVNTKLSGACLRPEYNPTYGGYSSFNGVALTAESSAMWTDLSHTWSVTDTPCIQRDNRYVGVIGGEKQTYLIVADDIQKDSSLRTYEWYLHTGANNTVTLPALVGQPTVIQGGRDATHATKLNVYGLGPEMETVSANDYTRNSSYSDISDKIVKFRAVNTAQARFLHLLIPENGTNPAPTVARTVVTNGIQAVATWADGSTDTILWRYSGDTITSTGDHSVTSDARLTVVRRANNQVTGLMVIAGRSVTIDSQLLLGTADGAAPITVTAFGEQAAISAPDTAVIRLGLPYVSSAVLDDGLKSLPIYNDGSVVYINGGLPLSQYLRHDGVLFSEDFNDGYAQELNLINLNKFSVDQFKVKNGALEIPSSNLEWPSFTQRDSYPFKRAYLFPNAIQSTINGDADYTFRYKFNDVTSGDRIFSAYFKTVNRYTGDTYGTGDWGVNQDYIKLEMVAHRDPATLAQLGGNVANTLTIGERVNGTWVWNYDNDGLTTSIQSTTLNLANTDWHTVAIHLENNAYVVRFDGQIALSGTIPSTHASGYMQWKVIGDATVMLDDVKVTAIDHTAPINATSGRIARRGNGGTAIPVFSHGRSTDADTITVYESTSEILADTNPATLTVVGSAAGTANTISLPTINPTAYHAVMVSDASGNKSQLTPLAIDATPPAAVTDLHAD